MVSLFITSYEYLSHNLPFHSAPEPWQLHPIAKRVHNYAAPRTSSPQEQEADISTKEGRVGKLEKGAEKGVHEWDVRMREGELVGVVDVRDAEVKRRVEQGLPGV